MNGDPGRATNLSIKIRAGLRTVNLSIGQARCVQTIPYGFGKMIQ